MGDTVTSPVIVPAAATMRCAPGDGAMEGDDVLDVEAAVDDAAWARRMREARRPPPEVVVCGDCEGRALGPDATPCPGCYGLGTVEVWP